MKITDEMLRAYRESNGGEEPDIRQGLAAVFELIENSPVAIVMVSREQWDSMKQDVEVLRRLEAAGVDNWSNYDAAMEGLDG